MSVHAYSWAWQQDVETTDKLVLLAMCDFADQTGICWPSHSTLARMAGLHRSTVWRSIETLIASGLVMRGKGRGKSNTYRLMLASPRLPPESRASAMWDESVPAANARAFPELSPPVAQCNTSDDPNLLHSATPPVAQRDTTCRAGATPPVALGATRTVRNRQGTVRPVDNENPDAWHLIPQEARELAAVKLAELRAEMALRHASVAIDETATTAPESDA